jgi:hypothetical protein
MPKLAQRGLDQIGRSAGIIEIAAILPDKAATGVLQGNDNARIEMARPVGGRTGRAERPRRQRAHVEANIGPDI